MHQIVGAGVGTSQTKSNKLHRQAEGLQNWEGGPDNAGSPDLTQVLLWLYGSQLNSYCC